MPDRIDDMGLEAAWNDAHGVAGVAIDALYGKIVAVSQQPYTCEDRDAAEAMESFRRKAEALLEEYGKLIAER